MGKEKSLSCDTLRTYQLCEKLQVSRQVLHEWRKAGMPCVVAGPKTMCYYLPSVMQWLEGREVRAGIFAERRE